MVDCVYIAASAGDARYTRICVASVRYFYPEIPIRLLAGGRLQRGLADELQKYWNVGAAQLPATGDYGWGFVKLEALYGPPGERFLVLDSDTVLTGPVLNMWNDSCAPFLVDDEKQTEADTKRLYYDWENLRKIDPSAQPPEFVFNSGQWFGTAGVLTRADFAPWLDWTMPRKLRHPELFMPGEQGVLNYLFNRKAALEELQVERRPIMRWPGHSMDGLDAERVIGADSAASHHPLGGHEKDPTAAHGRQRHSALLRKVLLCPAPSGNLAEASRKLPTFLDSLAALGGSADQAELSQAD